MEQEADCFCTHPKQNANLKGRGKMKRLWVRIVLVSTILPMLVACGMGVLMSVEYIHNASQNGVVNLGDSIFALSGEESDFLHSLSGETFRRYATSGAYMEGSFMGLAPDMSEQFDMAQDDDPNIDTVFMDGGGNDILIPATALDPYNCKKDWWESKLSTSCKNLINDIYVDTVDTLNDMGNAGVENLVFQGYYHLKNGLIGSTTLNAAVDYGDTKLAQAVANATAINYRVFVDPRGQLNTSSDIVSDGVHPSTSGSQKLANLVWAKLAPLL
jgi:lysophospholipase L1-like esterase